MMTETKPAIRYHIGLRASYEGQDGDPCNGLPCPVDSITLAGVTFHRHTEHVTGWDAEMRRERVMGGYAELTPDQLKAIKSDLDRTRVQFRSIDPSTNRPRIYTDEDADPPRSYVKGRIVTIGVRGYVPRESDARFGGWLYLEQQTAATVYEQTEPHSIQASNIFNSGSKPRK